MLRGGRRSLRIQEFKKKSNIYFLIMWLEFFYETANTSHNTTVLGRYSLYHAYALTLLCGDT